MDAKCVNIIIFSFCILSSCINVHAYLLEDTDYHGDVPVESTFKLWSLLLVFLFSMCCVLLVFGCLSCCKQRTGFKEFRNSETNVNSIGLDFVNPFHNVAQLSRYSIFSALEAASNKQPDSIVTFEPLPEVFPNKFSNLKSSQFSESPDGFMEEWLGDPVFPRHQLHYLNEFGQGWFGKVAEGEARGILATSNKVYRVVVRILKEDASAAEQVFFLQEAKPFRDLSHPNILKLLGTCLENVPFLLVFETCSNGNLKCYMKQNVCNKDALVYQGVILRMAVDIVSGLSHMLQNGFVHTDVAARNCLVTGELRIKVGDYGISLHEYKDEYYFNGDIALPIRWYAPETLNCTDTTIEPKQVTEASSIWSFGVLLWELEEWGELPYRELSDDQVISRVFGDEGLRLSRPANTTPYSPEIYNVMKNCWRDYVDRPSFINIMNSLLALLQRFRDSNFYAKWYSSRPNTVPVSIHEEKLYNRITSSSNCDTDSDIDLHDLKLTFQSQQALSKQRLATEVHNSESSALPRSRFLGRSTGDLFSSSMSTKVRSPSLEILHDSLDNMGNLNRQDEFESSDWSIIDSSSKVDFKLGLVFSSDASILWNNKPLFQSDKYLEDNFITKDVEEEIWRKRIERGEFTEKVKEKSKSVTDLMILTHIDCSESSESDSLPSFYSRQNSFNRQCQRLSSKNSGAPLSLLSSLSCGSESNLSIVEKDQEFLNTLEKIQIAKIRCNEDSLRLISLQSPSLMLSSVDKYGKISNFLANEVSEKHFSKSSHNNYMIKTAVAGSKTKLPLFDCNLFENTSIEMLKLSDKKTEPLTKIETHSKDDDLRETCETHSLPSTIKDITIPSSYSSDNISVVIDPSENHTLEYFRGVKTIVTGEKADEIATSLHVYDENSQTFSEFSSDIGEQYFHKCTNNVRSEQSTAHETYHSSYCDFFYDKCHYSNECFQCRGRSMDDNCSCDSFESLEKFRDCTTLHLCPFQSDDSGRGTDQINSGDGSGDKSLEGSISVQMNEVKNRLEVVIAKFTLEDDVSEDNCSSLEHDKDEPYVEDSIELRVSSPMLENVIVEEIDLAGPMCTYLGDDLVVEPIVTEDKAVSTFLVSEDNDNSTSFEESTCTDTIIDNSNSTSSENVDIMSPTSNDDQNHSSCTFVKVEQLFFLVDPKFEKDIEAELSKSCDLFSKSSNAVEEMNSQTEDGSTNIEENEEKGDIKDDVHSLLSNSPVNDNATSYEISDIMEGLSEPISLLYSVNQYCEQGSVENNGRGASSPSDVSLDCISSWLPQSIEDEDCKRSLEVDECFLEAIRKELRDKLPNSSTLAIVEIEEEVNTDPIPLSPILEEEEEEKYSFLSTTQSIASSDYSGSETINGPINYSCECVDLLVVDPETNDSSIVERHNSGPSSSSTSCKYKMNETYKIDNDDNTIGTSDVMDTNSLLTTDSLSPGTRSKTNAHLSYSSSECGNLSDIFLSPDNTQLLKNPQTIRQLSHDAYETIMLNIDEMVKRPPECKNEYFANYCPSNSSESAPKQSELWLKSLFSLKNEPASLFHFDSSHVQMEFGSLSADFKSVCFPIEVIKNTIMNDLRRSDIDTESEKYDGVPEDQSLVLEIFSKPETVEKADIAQKVYAPENEPSSSENSQSDSLVNCETQNQSSTAILPIQDAKLKNSIALFGKANKQIRNFHVSMVEDDYYRGSYNPPAKAKTIDPYWCEKLAVSSSCKDSERTWKSPSGSYHGSSKLESIDGMEDTVNDLMMSTSFIENDSQDGSVDDKDENRIQSDDSEDEGMESTSDEFVWKESRNIAQNNEKTDAGNEDEDDDDEELADFVPFSWNCEAAPQRSVLKSQDKKNIIKKKVSFMKQKYHCVYEYPKEEPNYTRIYDNILQDRMLNIWKADQENLYNHYSSFSDWELDECGDERPNSNDDLLLFPTTVPSTTKSKLCHKLGFYTIGAYDLDIAKMDNYPPTQRIIKAESIPSLNYTSSDQSSPINRTIALEIDVDVLGSTLVREEGDKIMKICVNSDKKDTHAAEDTLGELKNTKNRLKLDLNGPVTSYKSSMQQTYDRSKIENCDLDEEIGATSTTEIPKEDTSFVKDYNLNYKSCDISPIIELKSLASTSVA